MGIPFNNIYIRVAAISLYSLLLVYISVNAYKKPFLMVIYYHIQP